jgi:CheY-like chemotaxis protein
VEDNESLLFNTKLMLKMNNYDVFTATNGREALDLLKSQKTVPDLIISDIMMPIMDGYELYARICLNEIWSHIPFIFLTAKSTSEDIRFGRKLGVDDYIIKPFKGEDLLASMEGRLSKALRNKNMSIKYKEDITQLEKDLQKNLRTKPEEPIIFLVDWDEKIGPTIVDSYPKEDKIAGSIKDISVHLYYTTNMIYDSKDWNDTTDAQFHINSLNLDAILVFASANDDEVRGGQRLFMLVALGTKFFYLESRRILEKLQFFAKIYKENHSLDCKQLGKEISEILK